MTDNGSRSPQRVLPVVLDMCERITFVFARYVGPVAHEIAKDIYDTWLQKGSTGPAGVARYIEMLSQHITEDTQRTLFHKDAQAAMRDALQRR